jgi:hypothetical protein
MQLLVFSVDFNLLSNPQDNGKPRSRSDKKLSSSSSIQQDYLSNCPHFSCTSLWGSSKLFNGIMLRLVVDGTWWKYFGALFRFVVRNYNIIIPSATTQQNPFSTKWLLGRIQSLKVNKWMLLSCRNVRDSNFRFSSNRALFGLKCSLNSAYMRHKWH